MTDLVLADSAGGPDPDAQLPAFRRLHPLTPVIRGWAWLAAFGAYSVQQALQDAGPLASAVGLAVIVPIAAAYGVISWWCTRYRIAGGDLQVERGLLFRQSRRVRLDRLQAVDVVRPLLGRLLGLAELRLEVAGGSSAEAPLAYLSEVDAQALRAELLARAAGLAPHESEAPEELVLEVPAGRLIGSVLLRPAFAFGMLTVLASGVAAALGTYAVAGTLVPLLVGMGATLYASFVRQFGFTLAESPDGLRIRAGLLDTRAQTVPPGRVQAVRVLRPACWRPFTNWVRVEVNVAGYGAASATSGVLLPVGTPAQAEAALAYVLPTFPVGDVLPSLMGPGLTAPMVRAPRRARRLRPLTWSGLGVVVSQDAFASMQGVLRRELVIVPHAKAQSVRLRQGPFQRRWGLATVNVDATAGPALAVAPHRDAAESAALLTELVERARGARAMATPDRWMTAPDS